MPSYFFVGLKCLTEGVNALPIFKPYNESSSVYSHKSNIERFKETNTPKEQVFKRKYNHRTDCRVNLQFTRNTISPPSRQVQKRILAVKSILRVEQISTRLQSAPCRLESRLPL